MRTQQSTIRILFLASRAVVAAAAGDYDALDRRFADHAGLAFAAVDAVLKLKEAFFAIGIDVIGDRGAAERNCFFQNFFHCWKQFRELLASDGGGAAARANSGAEQGRSEEHT